MENLDQGQFFDLLYEGEDDVLKLDVLEMVASVRQTYPFSTACLHWRGHGGTGEGACFSSETANDSHLTSEFKFIFVKTHHFT